MYRPMLHAQNGATIINESSLRSAPAPVFGVGKYR